MRRIYDWLFAEPEPEPIEVHPRDMRLYILEAAQARLVGQTNRAPTVREIWEEADAY
jgi:hypothetical protein